MSRVLSNLESSIWERWDAPSVGTDRQGYDGQAKAKLPTEQELEHQVENELVALATALVRQLRRREIKTEPTVVVAAVREALGVLPVAARNISVQLHPADAALVRELLPPQEDEQDWRLTENPAMTRGGCVVVTDVSHVDATVERRLAAAILKIFGGDRHADPRHPSPDETEGAPPAPGSASDAVAARPDT
ncbi:MAG: flagellar assembly protein FliH [Chromatiaceae bacterium]